MSVQIPMQSILKSLKLLSDPTRVRILMILRSEKLTVAEIQSVLGMGQSRISSQLSKLKSSGLIIDERSGKHVYYQLIPPSGADTQLSESLLSVLESAAQEIPECDLDNKALKHEIEKRSNKARSYFDELAGSFGKKYVPGRSWKSVAEMLFQIIKPGIVADLGAGEGTLSQLIAQSATKVIAVDHSEKMVDFGSKIIKKNGYHNIEYRLGDIQSPPIEDNHVDLVIFSQTLHHVNDPKKAVAEAYRILSNSGMIIILDLLKHDQEEARTLYADQWLGFKEIELIEFLEIAGFTSINTTIVDKENRPPYFETIMGIGKKRGPSPSK